MMSVQSLVAVDERGVREGRALIAAYLRDLVPVLLLHQSQDQLQEVASLIGITLLGSHDCQPSVGIHQCSVNEQLSSCMHRCHSPLDCATDDCCQHS